MINVVTVVKNNLAGVKLTIESVLKQNYNNFRYIIWDGNSTDGTLEYIKSINDTRITFISGSDKGVYDAMNKCLKIIPDGYVLFLNSGDVFYDVDILNIVSKNINGYDILYGDVIMQYRTFSRYIKAMPIDFIKYRMPCCHQAILMNVQYLKKYPFREMGINSDYECLLRCYKNGAKIKMFHQVISIVTSGGISDKRRLKKLSEDFVTISKYNPDIICLGKVIFYGIYEILVKIAKLFINEKYKDKILMRKYKVNNK